MRTSFNRRTATKVKDGRVQRKNRSRPTSLGGYVLDRESPGSGYVHVVTKRDVQAFLDIVPDWGRLSERLERIVLASPLKGADGCYYFYRREETGSIYLSAWHDDLWIDLSNDYFDSHQSIFERLGVSYDRAKEDVLCRFTMPQARAFMLLHVFMHELGHHFDYMHQKHHNTSRGEDYAERVATDRFEKLYPDYVRVFADPAREEG